MKLRNKLLLSCAALAACATTMVSTTFAWYTSNTEVTASGVTGGSAESGSELLLISKDGTKWGTSVTLDKPSNADKMAPVTLTSNKFERLDYTTGSLTTSPKESLTGTVSFDVYFKLSSTTAQHLYVTQFALTNTTGWHDQTTETILPTKNVIGGLGTMINSGGASLDTYSVDMLRVLKVAYTVSKTTGTETEGYNTAADPRVALDASKLIATSSYKDSILEDTAFDAHKYLLTVMDHTGDGTGEKWTIAPSEVTNGIYAHGTPQGVAWDLGELPTAGTNETKGQYVKVTFTLFLDGADKACFDAVQGQTFKLDMAFSTSDKNALTTKAIA